MEELIDKARSECRGAADLASEAIAPLSPDVSLALIKITKSVGIVINGLALVSQGAAEAMKTAEAARFVMNNVGRNSREALDTYKEEINLLKQRITELEGKIK